MGLTKINGIMVEAFLAGRDNGDMIFRTVQRIARAYYEKRLSNLPSDAADDFVQEVSLLVYNTLDKFDEGRGSFSTFVALQCREAARRFILDAQYAMITSSFDEPIGEEEDGSLYDLVEDRSSMRDFQSFENNELIMHAVESCLNKEKREVIERLLAGQSVKEIALSMGKCENTISTLKRRALMEIREAIVDER